MASYRRRRIRRSCLRLSSVAWPLQRRFELLLDHCLDEPANAVANLTLDRIKPTVENMSLGRAGWLRRLGRRGRAAHGVVSLPGAPTPGDSSLIHPGDYATSNSNQSRDGTHTSGAQRTVGKWTLGQPDQVQARQRTARALL